MPGEVTMDVSNKLGLQKFWAGKWIAVEGADGVGKSTLVSRLAIELNAFVSREPGGTELGERIRAILLNSTIQMDAMTEALLFTTSRHHYQKAVVLPQLKHGSTVLTDRSIYSMFAYQCYGSPWGWESPNSRSETKQSYAVDRLARISEKVLPKPYPDLCIVLDVNDDNWEKRITKKWQRETADRIERRPEDFHRRVRDGYRELAKRFKNYVIVDANGTPEEVFEKACEILQTHNLESTA